AATPRPSSTSLRRTSTAGGAAWSPITRYAFRPGGRQGPRRAMSSATSTTRTRSRRRATRSSSRKKCARATDQLAFRHVDLALRHVVQIGDELVELAIAYRLDAEAGHLRLGPHAHRLRIAHLLAQE